MPVAKKPVFVRIGPGISLGYRRNQTAGTWIVRAADGKGSNWTKAIGVADDFESDGGGATMNFWQAQDRARIAARVGYGGAYSDGQPLTVTSALDRYEADLKTRGGEVNNVARVRKHLPRSLAGRPVALLTSRELRQWRDDLVEHMAPASANRVATVLRTTLNLADSNEGLVNRSAWQLGLKALPDANRSRNVVLTDVEVRRLVTKAYEHSRSFGLLIELAAITGARMSQLARLELRDVKFNHLLLPTSRKGRGTKKITRRQIPIPGSLATKLLQPNKVGRPEGFPLLLKSNGDPWKKSDQTRPFQTVARLAGLDPQVVTMYALRHSSITRQLKLGVPIRVVAALHDTSVSMIEKTYSLGIDKHVDEMVRPALIDLGAIKHNRTTKVARRGRS